MSKAKYPGGRRSYPEYWPWRAMLGRCTNPADVEFVRYGGAGISVTPEWKDFLCFLAAVGGRPSLAHSLDRIDNERGYEPGNVRWATQSEQGHNRRINQLGERNNGSRLNDVAVRVIRFLASRGVSLARLARAHGVSKGAIGHVVSGRSWTTR